jgi:2-keto-4-pentenoate hydratase/2-oxohepta-3-ene-1,7-dioic acid hydratase in catechol pathway
VRIARFSVADRIAFGVVDDGETGSADDGDGFVTAIDGHPFGPFELTGARFALTEVRLLAPVVPSKVLAVGKNYADHAREMGEEPPEDPILFLKPSTAVIGPDDPIRLPKLSSLVHHEGELAVVIGRLVRELPIERAMEAVLGYTCGNDVTARDLQRVDGQWARAKGFDTFCPLGPWVVTDVDPGDLLLRCTVDGQVRQEARTSALLHSVAELVSYASAVMTLLPGDVLLTGTPAGVGPIVDGDVVEVSIDGIGTLTNPVVGP